MTIQEISTKGNSLGSKMLLMVLFAQEEESMLPATNLTETSMEWDDRVMLLAEWSSRRQKIITLWIIIDFVSVLFSLSCHSISK